MSVELATGYVNVVPSARGFGRDLQRQVSGVGSSIGTRLGTQLGDSMEVGSRGGFSRIGASLAGLATKGGVAMGLLATTGAGAAISIAGDFEQTTVAFEGLLGSAGAAQSLLGDLRDFAKRTPFEFPELADSARRLLGVGFAAEDVIPAMTDIGNVAATLGVGEAEIAGVVRALGQMKGKGKASAQELMQISEQLPGFSAIDAVAQSLGVSTAEAFKMMESGAISGDQGVQAILDGMAKFPGAANAMQRQSNTLNGQLSNLKDTVSQAAIDFVTPYLPQITSGVRTIGRGIEGFFSWLSDTGVPAGRAAFESIRAFISDRVAPAVARVGDVVGGVFAAVTSVDWAAFGKDLQRTFAPAIDAVASVDWAGLFGQVRDVAGEVGRFLAGIDWGGLWEGVLSVLRPSVDALTDLGTAVVEVAQAAMPTLTAAFRFIWPVLKVVGLAVGALAYVMHKVFLVQVRAVAVVLRNVLAPILRAVGWWIENAMIPGWRLVASVAGAAFEWIADKVSWWWNTVTYPILSAAWSWISDTLIPIFGRIWASVRDAFDQVATKLSTWWDTASGLLRRARDGFELLRATVKAKIDRVVDIFTGVVGRFARIRDRIYQSITEPFRSAFNAIAGFWNSTIGGFEVPSVNIPGFGEVGGWSIPEIPVLHRGGTVPGRPGTEVMALLEAGEVVLPRSAVRASAELAAGPAGGAPVIYNTSTADPYLLSRELGWQMRLAG